MGIVRPSILHSFSILHFYFQFVKRLNAIFEKIFLTQKALVFYPLKLFPFQLTPRFRFYLPFYTNVPPTPRFALHHSHNPTPMPRFALHHNHNPTPICYEDMFICSYLHMFIISYRSFESLYHVGLSRGFIALLYRVGLSRCFIAWIYRVGLSRGFIALVYRDVLSFF